MSGPWRALFGGSGRQELAGALLSYVRERRWFRSKARSARAARIVDVIGLPGPGHEKAGAVDPADNVLVVLEISFAAGEPEVYVIPLAQADHAMADSLAGSTPHALIQPLAVFAAIGAAGGDAALIDGLVSGQAAAAMMAIARDGRVVRGESGEVRGVTSPLFQDIVAGAPGEDAGVLAVRIPHAEQTNSTIMFGDRLLLKIYRQLTPGPNPELEVGRFLTEHCQPPCAPRVLGALSYTGAEGTPRSLGIVHELLPNDGDAWALALREVREFFARVAGRAAGADDGDIAVLVGRFGTLAGALGLRTGALHLALARATDDPNFAPEPLTAADRAAAVTRANTMLDEHLATLADRLEELPAPARRTAQRLLAPDGRQGIEGLLARFRNQRCDVVKTRTHGDLHLGQVLAQGDDFVIIDFEGEPARPLAERRAKSSPLRDAMGMVRSFDYAPAAVLRDPLSGTSDAGGIKPVDTVWAARWTRQVTENYLSSYLKTVADAAFIPRSKDDLSLMLTFYELEKVIYEIGYEVNHRPDWVAIPLAGLARIAGVEDRP